MLQCLFVDSRTTINDVMDWLFVAFLCRWDYSRVHEVFLVNNGWDDVRGLVMKSFIMHEDVGASVTRSPAPLKEHLAEVSLDIIKVSASCNSECRTWVSSGADYTLEWTLWTRSRSRPCWVPWRWRCSRWRFQTSTYRTAIRYYKTRRSDPSRLYRF